MVCTAKIYIYKHLTEHSFCGASQVSLVVNCPPANAGAAGGGGSIPGSGRSPRGGHANPLQYSCLHNPTERGAWRATDHRDAKGQTRLKRLSMHACRAFSWSISQIRFSLSVAFLCSYASSFNLYRLCFMAGFWWEKAEQERKEEAPAVPLQLQRRQLLLRR